MKNKKLLTSIVKNLVVWLTSAIMIIPLLLILINSLKDKYQSASMSINLPKVYHFENYQTVIEQGKLVGSFFNSMFYAGSSMFLGVVLSAMAAYVLGRNRNRLNRFLYFFIIMGIAMPINYVSLTKVMQLTHLMNTMAGLSLLYTALQIPFSVFLVYGFISTVPRDLDEAGIIDGCEPLRLFFSVIMPLLKPVLVTVLVLNFMTAWNDFTLPLYYSNSATKWPMTLAVYTFFGQFESQWNLVSADIILTSLPVIIIYLFGQKYIISGMTAGSVKG
jgi:raffinose/stachyose/melibiose transport system permease protein